MSAPPTISQDVALSIKRNAGNSFNWLTPNFLIRSTVGCSVYCNPFMEKGVKLKKLTGKMLFMWLYY